MMNLKYGIGHKFGRLTLKEYKGRSNQASKTNLWLCVCECGREIVAQQSNLVSHNTSSCGCLKIDLAGIQNKSHGEAGVNKRTKEYRTWSDIKTRCYNVKSRHYGYYGGRGITVCDRWMNSYEHFLEDIGRAPSNKHSIDRINVNGNYEPSNCYWATGLQQANNKRITPMIEINGQVKSFSDWCRHFGLRYWTVRQRVYKLNWPIEKAFELC